MRIFNAFILLLSTVSPQEDQLKIFTVNSDTVIKILNQKIEDDQRLSISYQLHSFDIDKNELEFLRLNLSYGHKCRKSFFNSKGFLVGTEDYKKCVLNRGNIN